MVRLLSYSLPALWLAAFPFRGALAPHGTHRRCVYIATRLKTGMSAATHRFAGACSSLGIRGEDLEGQAIPQTLPFGSSSTGLGSSIVVSAVGDRQRVGLTPLGPVGFTER